VVSGTNIGYNIGIDISYSGTVGASKQAQYYGYHTIALSADGKGNKVLQEELKKTIQFIFDHQLLSKDYTLNVNFPRDIFEHSKGIKMVEVYRQVYLFSPVIIDDKFKPNRHYIRDEDLPENSDLKAYVEGYTSISKLSI